MASCLFDTDFMGFKTYYEREERGHGKCNLVMVRLTETWIQTLGTLRKPAQISLLWTHTSLWFCS